jgi:hypothetical protein
LSLSLHIKDYSWGSRRHKERHPSPIAHSFRRLNINAEFSRLRRDRKDTEIERGDSKAARETEKDKREREKARSCLDLNSFVCVRVYPTSSSPLFSFSCSRNDI